MWKVIEHGVDCNDWKTIEQDVNLSGLELAQLPRNRFAVWDAAFPDDEAERDSIVRAMFKLNGERMHSIFIGARIAQIQRDVGDIKDPMGPCGPRTDPCFCVRHNPTTHGYCLTSYPLADGSFNIHCFGSGKCY